MSLLHSALKLVLWRRMGYYYLPATHPAIKTSGATSPQRIAAALPPSLPPFLSLSRSSYRSRARQCARTQLRAGGSAAHTDPRLTLCSHLLRPSRFSSTPLDIPPWVVVFFLFFSFLFPLSVFVNGHPRPAWGACEWTDRPVGWLRRLRSWGEKAMLRGQVRSSGSF